MALTELKSDLSKFRRPIQKPIAETQSTTINYDNNKTPLSGLLNGLPTTNKLSDIIDKPTINPNKIGDTPPKKGITPKYEKIERFVGETTPNPLGSTPDKPGITPNPLGSTPDKPGITPKYRDWETDRKSVV